MTIRRLIFIIIFISISVIFSPGRFVSALTPTPTPTKTTTPSVTTIIDKLKQIEVLKEKIATKVAELRENEKGALTGTVKSVTDNTITLTTKSADKTISYSEDTIFFQMKDGVKGEPLDWKQSKKLNPGDTIAVLGYFDTDHANFSAKYIYMINPLVHLDGKIADKDSDNYTITVRQPQGETLVDIETYTKMYSYTQKSGLVKSGFSKLSDNGIVHIFATPNPKETNRASALKIISPSFGDQAASPSATPAKVSSVSATPTKK